MKKKITLTILLILLIITIGLGSTYAYWQRTSVSNNNIVSSSCLDIEFGDEGSMYSNNNFSLEKAYPITDEEGLNQEPYSFYLINKCKTTAKVSISVDTLNNSTLDEQYIKYNLRRSIFESSYLWNGTYNPNTSAYGYKGYEAGNMISILGENEKMLPSNNEYKASHIIFEEILEPLQSEGRYYLLSFWLDKDSPIEETINKTWQSKISINAIPINQKSYTELITGSKFQTLLSDNNIDRSLIKSINTTNTKPSSNITTYKVSTEDSLHEVYMYIDNNNMYFYSEDPRIFLNEDSNNMFMNFNGVEYFEPQALDFYKVRKLNYGFGFMSNLEEVDFKNINLINLEEMEYLFINCQKLKTINGIDSIGLPKVKKINYAFTQTSISYLNLSTIVTTNLQDNKVTIAAGNTSLNKIDLSNWDFTKVSITDLKSLINSNLTNLKLYNAKFGQEPYSGVELQTFGTGKTISQIDITGSYFIGNMASVFSGLYNTKIIGLSTVNTSGATNFNNLFNSTNVAEYINEFNSWDVSNVTNFNYFIGGYTNIPYDLTALNNWNINSNATLNNLFAVKDGESNYTLPNWQNGTWKNESNWMSFIPN